MADWCDYCLPHLTYTCTKLFRAFHQNAVRQDFVFPPGWAAIPPGDRYRDYRDDRATYRQDRVTYRDDRGSYRDDSGANQDDRRHRSRSHSMYADRRHRSRTAPPVDQGYAQQASTPQRRQSRSAWRGST
ncbi:hypothetical protein DYB31_013331, partial [Aphanomyces astaci]